MLYCTDCEQFFEEEKAEQARERVGEFWGTDAYRDYLSCPYCGSDQIEEAQKCKVCGRWIQDEGHDQCEHCRDDAFDMYCVMLLDIKERNPEAELKDVLDLMGDEFEHFWNVKL